MNEPVFGNSLLEAVFRQAVIENFERELKEIESDPDIEISERHERSRRRDRAVLLWAKRLSAVAASLFILVGCALLTVPEVRASVSDTIITWFNGFTVFGPGETAIAPDGVWEPSSAEARFGEASCGLG
jgi:hypothetical protein